MASTGKCEYCGGVILSSDKTCPACGATNLHYVDDAPSVVLTPHTIKELAEYCAERNMPLQRMRFFIGENYQKPKAFGIYQNNAGEFVVYKNKADGSRSIRYIGRDEEYAVKFLNEFQDRLCFGMDVCLEPTDDNAKLAYFLIKLRDEKKISEEIFRKVARENISKLLGL